MRILVVEDEQDLNLLLQKVLKKAGYTVDGCYDGEDAQLHLLGAEYDGILLDVMMPKVNGYELIQELRQAGNDTPVLFLTARDSVEDRIRGLDLGADDYLVKPFDFGELLARIRAMTRKKAGHRSNVALRYLSVKVVILVFVHSHPVLYHYRSDHDRKSYDNTYDQASGQSINQICDEGAYTGSNGIRYLCGYMRHVVASGCHRGFNGSIRYR